jgi:hypothetical protein
MMQKSTYPGKHIAVRIVAAKHLLNKTIKQMAQGTWRTIYNQPKFKSNVLRGYHWQRLLQWNLLEKSLEAEENKLEIISDFIDEHFESKYNNQIEESDEKEAQEQLQQRQQKAATFIQHAIKIKLEPNTTVTKTTSNNDDEDSIATITID